jgi:acetoin utilization deacetylase AcuC-like enzyme
MLPKTHFPNRYAGPRRFRDVFDSGRDPGFLDVLDQHPENADRVRNMVSILRRGPIAPFLSWHSGHPAHASELLSFHSSKYIEEHVQANATGAKKLCEGTFLTPASWGAALLAAGTTISAVKHILDGHGNLAYALVCPLAITHNPTVLMVTAF